jgi:hypothetical protein
MTQAAKRKQRRPEMENKKRLKSKKKTLSAISLEWTWDPLSQFLIHQLAPMV